MALITEIVDNHAELTAIRRDIHRHPELAYEEHRTADLVAEQLQSYGVEVSRGLAGTGVVGTLKAGGGNRAVALRADMDALAMDELNTFEHASVHAGKMHGCGHDGHTTMLLGAARHLAAKPDFDGTVHFIFQPAEEGFAGAKRMIEEGLFDQFPVENVWGMHNYPTIPTGHFATCTGPFLPCSDTIEVTVNGVGGHGAQPHLARSPVNAACAIIQSVNEFLAQEIDTQFPTTFTVGRIHGGDAINGIPDQVTFAGTMRSFSKAVQDQLEAGVRRIVDGVCGARGISGGVRYERNYPVLENSAEETVIAAKVAAKVAGPDAVNAAHRPIMGSEDFAFMLQAKPGNYIFIGNGAGEAPDGRGVCMVHNPRYDFNDEILPIGATYWVELVKELLPAA